MEMPFSDTDTMPLISETDQIMVVVSGKLSSYIALVMGWSFQGIRYRPRK